MVPISSRENSKSLGLQEDRVTTISFASQHGTHLGCQTKPHESFHCEFQFRSTDEHSRLIIYVKHRVSDCSFLCCLAKRIRTLRKQYRNAIRGETFAVACTLLLNKTTLRTDHKQEAIVCCYLHNCTNTSASRRFVDQPANSQIALNQVQTSVITN